MGHNPIPLVPVRKARSLEDQRIDAVRDFYIRDRLTLEEFEWAIERILYGSIDPTNDYQVFAEPM